MLDSLGNLHFSLALETDLLVSLTKLIVSLTLEGQVVTVTFNDEGNLGLGQDISPEFIM